MPFLRQHFELLLVKVFFMCFSRIQPDRIFHIAMGYISHVCYSTTAKHTFLWRFIVDSSLNKKMSSSDKTASTETSKPMPLLLFHSLQGCGSQHYTLHINLLKGHWLVSPIPSGWKWIRWEVFKMDLQGFQIKNLCISASLLGDSEYLTPAKLFHLFPSWLLRWCTSTVFFCLHDGLSWASQPQKTAASETLSLRFVHLLRLHLCSCLSTRHNYTPD